MAKILVVEDDEELSEIIVQYLTKEKHVVDALSSGAEAVDRLRLYSYDAVVLDWGLPDLEGIEVLRRFSANGGKIPAIMLTGRREISDKEQGLDSGADDYLTKPFDPRELAARLRAVLRRPESVQDSVLTARHIVLDPLQKKVLKSGEELRLTPKEFSLLEFFMRNPAQVFSSQAILDRVWSTESDASPDTVRVHVTQLRAKIDLNDQASLVRTVHRVGYVFEL